MANFIFHISGCQKSDTRLGLGEAEFKAELQWITSTESSDIGILDLLRKAGPLGVTELAGAMRVTATAVRQRLARLMARGHDRPANLPARVAGGRAIAIA